MQGDYQQLERFLARPDQPAGTMGLVELHGFLFAVAAAPELVKPSDWLPLVFGEGEPTFDSSADASSLLGAMMSIYNDINDAIARGASPLPPGCEFRDDVLANLEEDAPISQWSRGFARGHQWLQDVWDSLLPDQLDKDVGLMLMTMSFFISRRMAERMREETQSTRTLAEMADIVRQAFPDMVLEYARLGRTIERVVRDAERPAAPPPRTPRVGRNDPCPCGSGRKYKKCCGA
jgi:uncharacterized protein